MMDDRQPIFVEMLNRLAPDELQALTESLEQVNVGQHKFRFIILPANVHVSTEQPAGYIFRESETDDGGHTTQRELVFLTKEDLYDFLASPTFQGLEQEAEG